MNSAFDTIEKIFRYFIPGFIFVVLFKLSFPSKPEFILDKIGKVEFYIYIPCIGMVIYGLHRLLFEIVEIVFYKLNLTAVSIFASDKPKLCEFPLAAAKFLKVRHTKIESNLSGYLFYRWSLTHYTLILSELLLIFCFINEKGSIFNTYFSTILVFSLVVFALSLLHAIIMYSAEKNLLKNNL